MLSGKRIILGVTGGIAAYKAVYLLREYQKAGAEIRVTMTQSATRFVGSETFAALCRYPVAIDVFSEENQHESWTKHIHWGEWADIFVIAPCTANTLAKIVQGNADNMLTSTVLAARCPLLICPTMDGEMYESPAVTKNLEQARNMGIYILEPESGYLASGLEAVGRLPEISAIHKKTDQVIQENRTHGLLSGKKVLVTAGPTREFIDPVRFISNPSSGKMGVAMADAAVRLGADVLLLKGPVTIQEEERMAVKSFTSAQELYDLVRIHQKDSDIIIMAAAVSDFTPAETFSKKVKKDQASDTIKLQQTIDILHWLGDRKTERQTLIGFAMETDDLEENARNKLQNKKMDWICANLLTDQGSGFESNVNAIQLFGKKSKKEFKGPKKEIAMQILREIFER